MAVQEERWRQRAVPSRPWLMNRSCTILASLGLGFMETFRGAPRIVRRLAFRAVIPLISFYEVAPAPVSCTCLVLCRIGIGIVR